MKEYADKQSLIDEIKTTSEAFINEFTDISESEKDLRMDGVDRTPAEMIAYQLGWMELIRGWDKDERDGKPVETPAPGIKWNQMGELYQGFYKKYADKPLAALREQFVHDVADFIQWFDGFSEDEVFKSGGRAWASSTPSNWPIWKWVRVNTAAPFTTFRTKIRKWKKLKGNAG
jgi:hypothetical protein